MQCCVPLCVNTTKNVSTSERTGITFHELPSEDNLRTAWLKALGILDQALPNHAVVCSQHFLDEDFVKAEGCVRQIRSDAIPSTLQMCMMCLDTDSKLLLMSKHKLEEMYEQLTGLHLFQLCHRGNLRPTLCVLCAQRLINFRRFRELSWRAHSLILELLEKHGLITIQHKELMTSITKHLQCNLTQRTLGADHCDLYIDHTDEEEQTAAEESAAGDVATAVVKNEEIEETEEASDSASADDIHETETKIKIESVTFECRICYEDFLRESDYNEHMSMHEDTAREPRAAAGCSWGLCVEDKSECDTRSRGQDLNDDDDTPLARYSVLVKSEPIVEIPIVEDQQSSRSNTSDENPRKRTQTDDDKPFSCDMCSYKCARKSNLASHRRTHTGEKPYSCDLCPYKAAHQGSLINHISTHTGEKPYVCKVCNYKFLKRTHLIMHKRTHTGEKPYSCEECDYKCARKGDLKKHKRTHTGEKPYACHLCDYKAAQRGGLLNHMCVHTGEKPYTCDVCNYKFVQKAHLIMHTRTHTGEKPYSCGECDYKCARKGDLNKHKLTHSEEKPFACHLCHYKAAQKGSYLIHMRTHIEKPYACQICNYKCAKENDMKRHKRTHTIEKPHSCEMCNYVTADKSHLLIHLRIHTGEKPYCCDICDYRCAQKNDLLKHNRTHTGEKPYSCETCSYKCARKSNLLRHMRGHVEIKPQE